MVKYSSRRCSLDHGYSRDIGAEFEKAAKRAPLLAGGAGAPSEDRPHLCQFAGTTDLLGYDRHRGQASPRPRCRSLGSPETAVDRQYRAKKSAPLVEQLKYRASFTSESDHLRHLSSRLPLSIARVPDTPYRQEPGHRALNSDETNKINEEPSPLRRLRGGRSLSGNKDPARFPRAGSGGVRLTRRSSAAATTAACSLRRPHPRTGSRRSPR